jgi:hypothetical protein
MKLVRWAVRVAGLSVVFILLPGGQRLSAVGTPVPERQNYCNQENCGCAPPSLGTVLYFSCACSSSGQWRVCDYQ